MNRALDWYTGVSTKNLVCGEPVHLDQLQYGLWALAVIGQIAAGACMLKRRLHRIFPVLFCYILFEVARSTALFVILRLMRTHVASYRFYFGFYWITNALSIALCFFLVFEISRNFLFDYPLARQIVSFCLALAAIVLLLCDILLVRRAPGHESHQLISTILLLDRSVAVIQTGLVLVLFACSQVMALPWRTNLSFGVSLGLGLLGVTNLVADSARAHYGAAANGLYALAQMFAYVLAVVIWLVYILAPRKKTKISLHVQPEATEVAQWSEALTELVRQQ
jgi:hypothetical protein